VTCGVKAIAGGNSGALKPWWRSNLAKGFRARQQLTLQREENRQANNLSAGASSASNTSTIPSSVSIDLSLTPTSRRCSTRSRR